MHKSIWHGVLGVAVISAGVMLSACSGGGGASGSTPATSSTTRTPAAIVLTTSARTVNSDGTSPATITASVVDANNLGVSGATVRFTSNSGQFGTSSGVSSSDGVVSITFGAGTDPTNRTEMVTATVNGSSVSKAIPIKVSGSTLTVNSTQLVNSTNSVTVAATAKDLSGAGVEGQDIRFSLDTSNCPTSTSCGNGTFSAASARTDANGIARVTLVPNASGPVTVKTEWFNASGTSTYTVSSTVAVTAVGTAFAITSPSDNYTLVYLGSTQGLSATVPSTISGKAVATVRLSTTLGVWSNGAKSIILTPSANAINEVLTSGNSAGTANIQLDARDATGATIASLNRAFALSAPASQAGLVTLQPSVSNVAPSTAGTTNTATLTATVRTAGTPANVVGNAPVLFEIVNSTGSGEEISPVLVYTNGNGQAQTTFTSGSQSTIGGLQIRATVLGIASTVTDTKSIFVNATGVSVSLGRANVVSSVDHDTNYAQPMSVLVVDNAGTAVRNALVTLSAFPSAYFTGYRASDCGPVNTGAFLNEDANENEILDPGEDANGDGLITPPHASAGTVPSTVTTDENGVATFTLTYQKQYASWVQTRVRAKVVIATGTTESVNELKFRLAYSIADATPCTLPNSPANW